MRILLLLIFGAMLVAGCSGSDGGQAGPGPSSEPTTGSTSDSTTDPTTTDPPAPGVPTPTLSLSLPLPLPQQPNPTAPEVEAPATLLDQVRADAAQRTGVAPAEVQIVRTTAQTWSDGSLGCPRPGETYVQVTVDGYQIIARAGGRPLDYRASQTGIRLCEQY